MGIFLIILGWALIIGAGGLTFWRLRLFRKSGSTEIVKNELYMYLLALAAAAIGGIASNIGYALQWVWDIDPLHYIMMLFGAALLYPSAVMLVTGFYLHYYHRDLKPSQYKLLNIFFYVSIPVLIGSFLLAGEGIAPYLAYPLISGFSIGNDGFVWNTALNKSSGGLNVNWYGVVIVLGAIIAYKLSDHHLYQKYGKHGIGDTCFLIAFPAGIIAARIWYVVGNWNGDGQGGPNFSELCANGQWFEMFAIWKGGLTILGGAVGGIIAGAIYMIWKKRWVDLRFVIDCALPTILIAQAIGRWGNFFNAEVYGNVVDMNSFPLLPTWIKMQMVYSSKSTIAPLVNGQMYTPLFLFEGIFNVLGYFVIYHLVRRLWKEKYRPLGCIGSLYLVWYGVVRIIMEPMRDPNFNMGSNGMWSVWNSLVYIILGVLAIGACFAIAIIRKKKGLPVEMGTNVKREGKWAIEEETEEVKPLDAPEPLDTPKPIPTEPKEKKNNDALSAPRKIKRPGQDEEQGGQEGAKD